MWTFDDAWLLREATFWKQYLNNSEQTNLFYAEQAIADIVGSQTSLKSWCQVI